MRRPGFTQAETSILFIPRFSACFRQKKGPTLPAPSDRGSGLPPRHDHPLALRRVRVHLGIALGHEPAVLGVTIDSPASSFGIRHFISPSRLGSGGAASQVPPWSDRSAGLRPGPVLVVDPDRERALTVLTCVKPGAVLQCDPRPKHQPFTGWSRLGHEVASVLAARPTCVLAKSCYLARAMCPRLDRAPAQGPRSEQG